MKIEHKPDGVEVTLSRRNLEALLDGLLYADYPASPSLTKFDRKDGRTTFLRVIAEDNTPHYADRFINSDGEPDGLPVNR